MNMTMEATPFLLLLLYSQISCHKILTVFDDDVVHKKICIEKHEPTIAYMIDHYTCLGKNLDPKYLPLIAECWSTAGIKSVPKTKDDWITFYCNKKYNFMYKYIAEKCVMNGIYKQIEAANNKTGMFSQKLIS